MSYNFPPDIRTLVDQSMATGEYASEDQVLQAALHVLSDYHAAVADIRQGIEDFAQGRAQPLDQAIGDIRDQLGLRK